MASAAPTPEEQVPAVQKEELSADENDDQDAQNQFFYSYGYGYPYYAALPAVKAVGKSK